MKKIIVLLFAALPLLGWAQDSLYIQKIPNGLCEVHQLYLVRDSEKVLLYEMGDEDGSSIDYEGRFTKKGAYDSECYAIYNNVADGNNFLFYDRLARTAYFTNACFCDFKPIWETVDFKNKSLLLNYPSASEKARSSKDTPDVGSGTQYVSASHSDKMIKAGLVKFLKPVIYER